MPAAGGLLRGDQGRKPPCRRRHDQDAGRRVRRRVELGRLHQGAALMRQAKVHRIATSSPDDVSGLASGIAGGTIAPEGIIAILGKTEGNGCVNDFTRAFAVQSLKAELGRHLPPDAVERIAYVMSGGTEGAL